MRDSCSGDQNDGGAHLRDAGSEPRRVVAVGGAEVVGNDAGDEQRRRGSPAVFGEDGVGAVASGQTSAWGSVFSTEWTVVKLLDKVGR